MYSKIRFSDPADFAKLGFQFDCEAENLTVTAATLSRIRT
jgi:hypothetical protein